MYLRLALLLLHWLLLLLWVLLVQRRAAGLAVAAASFYFQIWAPTNPNNLLRVNNLRRFYIQVALAALLELARSEGTLHAESTFQRICRVFLLA